MHFSAVKSKVLNRGVPPDAFLAEMVTWARTAPDDIFAPNPLNDIYSKVKPELGPYEMDNRAIAKACGVEESKILPHHHRRAVMLEVMRVLAGFESSWDWKEGVDTSRLGADTAENAEAGAWQVSYDSRLLSSELKDFLRLKHQITGGIQFQQSMKFNHPLAMEYVARLMRVNTKHNGPLYKGDERAGIRSSLRGPEHSIFPWLRRDAVAEFQALLA